MIKHVLLIIFIISTLFGMSYLVSLNREKQVLSSQVQKESYWFILHRKSNTEDFLYGEAGEKEKSKLIKQFPVKTGIPKERPTPLPQLVGKEYWIITEMHPEMENPETAPYFLTLNIPAPTDEPYGPVPYKECGGEQCNWIVPGAFGLHGTGGMPEKLSPEDVGSSGCIRHSDSDITYLYNLLQSQKEEIRYYIEDN